jgi:hypothetical protein
LAKDFALHRATPTRIYGEVTASRRLFLKQAKQKQTISNNSQLNEDASYSPTFTFIPSHSCLEFLQ